MKAIRILCITGMAFLCMDTGSVLATDISKSQLASLDVARLDLDSLALTDEQLGRCVRREPEILSTNESLLQKGEYSRLLKDLPPPDNSASKTAVYFYARLTYQVALAAQQKAGTVKAVADRLAQAQGYFVRAAQLGEPRAMYDLAVLADLQSSPRQRRQWLSQAAQLEYVPAMLALAEDQFVATSTYEQRAEAQALLQRAAQRDPSARRKLASYYLHDDRELAALSGYAKDISQAIYLLYEAALACDAKAAYRLYELADHAHKPNRLSPGRAQYWLMISAELGLARAQGELAGLYTTQGADPALAIKWAQQAASQGDLKGLLTLAQMYYSGHGADKDHSRAAEYFEKALQVDQNNRLVQNQLGIMYYRGEGVDTDFRRAASLCKRAANKGQAGCQYYLGLMYVNGEGVTQDIDTGISWMKKSAAQDYTIAKNWLRENW